MIRLWPRVLTLLVLLAISSSSIYAAPARLLVKLQPGAAGGSVAAAAQFHSRAGGRLLFRLDAIHTDVVLASDEAEARRRYAAQGGVVRVEVDRLNHAQATPNDPLVPQMYGLARIRAFEAWDLTQGSAAVKVAVLDTGYDINHPDLRGKVASSADFTAQGIHDLHGHGTHTAGTVAAATNNGTGVAGVGWNISLAVGKVLGNNGSGYDSWIARGIIWGADQGARVISMSLLGGASQAELDAVRYAHGKGVLLVAAAGNCGCGSEGWPAAFAEVMAVAATDSQDRKASFSAFYPDVEIAAPGVGILSTYRNPSTGASTYASLSGTSMATPHVAGVAGLVFSRNPALTGEQVRSILNSTARDLGTAGRDIYFGHGIVDARRAVEAAGTNPTPPPPPPPPTPEPETPAQEMVRLINDARAQNGLPMLQVDSRLTASAVEWARWMANDTTNGSYRCHFGKDNPDTGELWWQRIRRHGYPGANLGENIASGFLTTREAFDAFMATQSTRDRILSPAFRHIGSGYAEGGCGKKWVVDFGGN